MEIQRLGTVLKPDFVRLAGQFTNNEQGKIFWRPDDFFKFWVQHKPWISTLCDSFPTGRKQAAHRADSTQTNSTDVNLSNNTAGYLGRPPWGMLVLRNVICLSAPLSKCIVPQPNGDDDVTNNRNMHSSQEQKLQLWKYKKAMKTILFRLMTWNSKLTVTHHRRIFEYAPPFFQLSLTRAPLHFFNIYGILMFVANEM